MNSVLVTLLLNLGGSLSAALLNNPKLSGIIGAAVTGTDALIATLTNKTNGTSIAVPVPVFFDVLQASLGVLRADGQITDAEYTALADAIAATLKADADAQKEVVPTNLAPVQTLP